ncbi:MAG: hypothetical protein HUK40_14050 [Desulfobacter sp.]|nr:hypothetical protein [Desulfobacter sp.]
MVEGVYQGNIDAKIALYEQIGGDHLGKDFLQKTTNFMGRALNQIFSKSANNKAVSNLIEDIREKPGFGDKYADMAKAKLTSLVGRGKPLTGRVASQVLSEIKLARTEDMAMQANIGINIDTYLDAHADGLMDDTFGDYQEGIGADLMTEQDRASIKEEATNRLKTKFTQGSPSDTQMKDELASIAKERCRVKIMDHNNAKIDEALETLGDDIRSLLEEKGEKEVELSDAVIAAMKKKISNKLAIASQDNHRLYGSPDSGIEKTKAKVMDTLVQAFTCITQAEDVPDNVKQILKKSLASDEIMLTKDISLSVIQGYKQGLCDGIADAIKSDDRSEETMVKFAKKTLADLGDACLDPETGTRRDGIDGYSLETIKFCLCKIAIEANGLDREEGQTQVKSLYDACIDASAKEKDMLTAAGMEILAGQIALTADLMPEIQTEKFLEKNPGIPLGAKDMIKDIFANIPSVWGSSLQKDALDLVKEHTSPPNGLPTGARVEVDRTDPEHPKPVLNFESVFVVDKASFEESFGGSTAVSDSRFKGTALSTQFVVDLARAPITFKEGETQVRFGRQEGLDAQKQKNPGTDLETKFVKACGGDKNQARALSILLNQSFAGVTSVLCGKKESMPSTGGGAIQFGAGTDHGPFTVTNQGQGKFTVEYSAKVTTEMMLAGSIEDKDVPIQMVSPGGDQTNEFGLTYSYDIDLSGIGETATEADLAKLISFHEGSPAVSFGFVNK